MESRLQNVKSQYQYVYWNVQTPELLEWGAIFSPAEWQEFLDYELHIKVTVLYFWCSLRCVKYWIVICYKEHKFPQEGVVLLLLESDAACTSLNGNSASKRAVLVLVWCWVTAGDRELIWWRYWPPEGCNKKWYDLPTGDGCITHKCWLVEEWSSDISLFCNLSKHSNIQSKNTRFET